MVGVIVTISNFQQKRFPSDALHLLLAFLSLGWAEWEAKCCHTTPQIPFPIPPSRRYDNLGVMHGHSIFAMQRLWRIMARPWSILKKHLFHGRNFWKFQSSSSSMVGATNLHGRSYRHHIKFPAEKISKWCFTPSFGVSFHAPHSPNARQWKLMKSCESSSLHPNLKSTWGGERGRLVCKSWRHCYFSISPWWAYAP